MERWGGGGFSPLPLPSCQKQEKWKHIKKNPDRLCTMHYYTSLYSAGCKEKIAVDKAVFWGTVSQMNLQKSRFFCRKYPLLSLPFLSHLQLLERNFDTMNILRIFKPPFVQWLFFNLQEYWGNWVRRSKVAKSDIPYIRKKYWKMQIHLISTPHKLSLSYIYIDISGAKISN